MYIFILIFIGAHNIPIQIPISIWSWYVRFDQGPHTTKLTQDLSPTEESKNAARIFTEQSSNLLEELEQLERQLHERIASHIPRDLDSLEHLVLQHKDWETSLRSRERAVEEVQATFRGKWPQCKMTVVPSSARVKKLVCK